MNRRLHLERAEQRWPLDINSSLSEYSNTSLLGLSFIWTRQRKFARVVVEDICL